MPENKEILSKEKNEEQELFTEETLLELSNNKGEDEE